MATRKAQGAAREQERDNLVRDLNALEASGRKVANSYSEYVTMLESDTPSDVNSLMIQAINPSYKAALQPESFANLSHYLNTEKFLKIYAALLTDDFG